LGWQGGGGKRTGGASTDENAPQDGACRPGVKRTYWRDLFGAPLRAPVK
jgi:hypothetical protein